MGQPVVHWEIAAQDAKKMWDFYGKLFDWKIKIDTANNYGEVTTGGEGGINGGIMQAKDPNYTYLTFYVKVDDLAACLAKAESLGGKTMLPFMPIPGIGDVAFFSDPEGKCIGLYKPYA